MNVHPAANIFPMMSPAELADLVGDIQVHGQHEPIVTYQGQILDGRNRWTACVEAGCEPLTREWDGEGDPVAFVLSLNLHRRHLSESQRAMVAAKIANMGQGRPLENRPIGRISQGAAAEMLNVGERSVRRAAAVIEVGTPELVAAVDAGRVAVSMAATLTAWAKTKRARTAYPHPAPSTLPPPSGPWPCGA
jgi:hypothetical protein